VIVYGKTQQPVFMIEKDCTTMCTYVFIVTKLGSQLDNFVSLWIREHV